MQQLFNSDIRSMINYMQSNEQLIYNKKIIQEELWEKISVNIINKNLNENLKFISAISIEYNIEKKNIIKNYLNYLIRNKKNIINSDFLSFIENIMHISDLNINYMLPYTILKLNILLNNVQ